ncbi:hypothetical protein FOG94_17015 [Cellulosimicrobium cellulans]|uniref:Uncharacterized protein n=1 Tax=Cellulosimicrobium cellulans TaxID=1710 RepID=A0ABX5XG71_CELCE|nr:hypothetical protein FOG94_17015 [Cellulosimicrobium cellulans]
MWARCTWSGPRRHSGSSATPTCGCATRSSYARTCVRKSVRPGWKSSTTYTPASRAAST